MESLALRFRPRTFDDLVGQKAVQVILRQMVLRDAVPAALLFDGSRGTGKTTTARILAAALNCDNEQATARPCTACVACKSVYDASSLDVQEIDAASNGLVDDIRALRQHLLYRNLGRRRVIILDEAHSMSPAAFNALLKTLEEPPPDTVFILVTTEPGRIPDTTVSRCMPFTFRRLAVPDITARLTHINTVEHLGAEPALLHLIAQRADGAMRDAVMALDQATRVGIHTAAAYADLIGHTDIGAHLLAALRAADTPTAYALLDAHTGEAHTISAALITTLRDLLILHAGGAPTCAADNLARRRHLAAAIDAGTALACLRVLWDLKTKIRLGEDPRASIDLAVAVIGDTLTGGQPRTPTPVASPAPANPPPARLSLHQMAAMR